MKISDYQQFELEFDCGEVGEFLLLYVLDRGDLSLDERLAVERHLEICIDCRKQYTEIRFVNDALIANRDYLIREGVFGETKKQAGFKRFSDKEADFLQFQAKMQRAFARRKKTGRRNKLIRSRFAVKTASAAAACLIIACGIWGIFANNDPTKKSHRQPAAAGLIETPVKIEMLTGSGLEIIRADQPVTASGGLKTLRINDNRKMILKAGTELSIAPHNLGCIVKLDKGEIYTEVQHDGKPFIVETIHGRAVITGTTFNIKADDKQMELIVVEGTVSFESDRAAVNVAAGYKSRLALNIEPALPVQCDTIKLTAWVKGSDRAQKSAVKDHQPEIDLSSVFGSQEIDLERIDYTSWIEQKRYWFKREFPHIFKFKEALAKEGIEVRYPELLIKSGSLQRFAYPGKTRTQLVPVSCESMIKLSSAYGKNEQWLRDNLHFSRANLTSENETSDLKAFDRWLNALEESLNSPSQMDEELLIYSLHASVYLSEARTLFWLAVKNDRIKYNTIEKMKLLELIEKQIKTANDCIMQFKQMFAESNLSIACDDEKQQKLLQGIIDNIKNITEIEKKITKYKTFSKYLRKEVSM